MFKIVWFVRVCYPLQVKIYFSKCSKMFGLSASQDLPVFFCGGGGTLGVPVRSLLYALNQILLQCSPEQKGDFWQMDNISLTLIEVFFL